MKRLASLFFSLMLSTAVFAGTPQTPPLPASVKMVQWDFSSSAHVIVFRYINPLQANLRVKVYGPQGYLIHVENIQSTDNHSLGIDLSSMSDGDYRVTLEADSFLLSDKIVTLQ